VGFENIISIIEVEMDSLKDVYKRNNSRQKNGLLQ
jgi:hypothetical protein